MHGNTPNSLICCQFVCVVIALLTLVSCQHNKYTTSSNSNDYRRVLYEKNKKESLKVTHGWVVPADVTFKRGEHVGPEKGLADSIVVHDRPRVKTKNSIKQRMISTEPKTESHDEEKGRFRYVGDIEHEPIIASAQRVLGNTIEAATTQTNIDNTEGFLFIPADPSGAAGPDHLVNTVNVSIEFYNKDGSGAVSQSLQDFFAPLDPVNFTFDPKVIYDQFESRFLVVTLEVVDNGIAQDNSASILLAVSDDSNPNGDWYMTRIPTLQQVNGNESWLDYPGFAVDEEAIYITGNMFSFSSEPDLDFNGVRLYIIEKGVFNGFYDNDPAEVSVFNPIPNGNQALTMQPAHVYGEVSAAFVGTFLVGYSGIQTGSIDRLQVIRVDNPLGNTRFTGNFISMGNVDRIVGPLNDAPQAGTNTRLSVNDRRTLNAVYRDDQLWTVTTVNPNFGSPDANQATALWVQMDVASVNNVQLADVGFIGGETIANNTSTYFPSIAVNRAGGAMIGFSASSSQIFSGAYFVHRSAEDEMGETRDAITLRAGTDRYIRTFGGERNRWGDYSSVVLDPNDECFWIYNKYAVNRGSATGSGDDGRWATAYGEFCNTAPIAEPDSLELERGERVTVTSEGETSLLANDTDPDPSDQLEVSFNPVVDPIHGVVQLFLDGSFEYIHDDSASTQDQFIYRVCDNGSPVKCEQAEVSIEINVPPNTPPTAESQLLNLEEDNPVKITLSGVDKENDPLNYVILTQPSNGQLSGFVPELVYQPDTDFNGADAFSFRVNDGQFNSPAAQIQLNIEAVNDLPIAEDDHYDIIDTGVNQITSVFGVLSNDSDVDNEASEFIAVLVDDVSNGKLQLNLDGSFEYILSNQVSATDAFTYRVDDGGGLSNIATVTLEIMADRIFDNGFESNE